MTLGCHNMRVNHLKLAWTATRLGWFLWSWNRPTTESEPVVGSEFPNLQEEERNLCPGDAMEGTMTSDVDVAELKNCLLEHFCVPNEGNLHEQFHALT